MNPIALTYLIVAMWVLLIGAIASEDVPAAMVIALTWPVSLPLIVVVGVVKALRG